MASKRAESTDQASFWAVDPAGLPGKLRGPTTASPQPGGMLEFATFHGFIRGMSVKIATRDFRRTKLEEPIRIERRFDLAMSVEVAEHLPPERAAGFVADLCALAPVVLFSAAIPGQGGEHHVNEQWPSYWSRLFAARGYRASDVLRPAIWNDEQIAWWYRQNLVLFASADACARHPKLAAACLPEGREPSPLVHPHCYAQALRRAEPHFGRWLKMGPHALRRRRRR